MNSVDDWLKLLSEYPSKINKEDWQAFHDYLEEKQHLYLSVAKLYLFNIIKYYIPNDTWIIIEFPVYFYLISYIIIDNDNNDIKLYKNQIIHIKRNKFYLFFDLMIKAIQSFNEVHFANR